MYSKLAVKKEGKNVDGETPGQERLSGRNGLVQVDGDRRRRRDRNFRRTEQVHRLNLAGRPHLRGGR